LNNPNSL